MNSISVTKSQENLNYAIYMIGGSYFEKTSCSNTRLETRLRVQYMEQKQEKQAALEEECIKYFEEKLLKNKALDDVWKQSVDCEFTAHALYEKLLRHAKHMIEKTCVSVMITEGMIIESKRLLRLLYETKNIEDFNKVLKELLSVCPRKVWKVEELLASSSDQIPEVIQREEDLVMAMQVVNGNQKKDLSFNAFDRYDISVSIPSEEKRQKVLELLAPELRRKVTNIYRIKTSKQEKKFKTYLKERNISEIKSLWHGSRNENWLSIVENSLSLNPNAVITGKMFGNGIYFAPNSLKSWGYTSGGYWTREMSNPTRFMGLYATAYGEPLNVSSPGQYSESKIGYHGCVHAHAGSYLRNDEIIFYNESAMLLTYLVEFTA